MKNKCENALGKMHPILQMIELRLKKYASCVLLKQRELRAVSPQQPKPTAALPSTRQAPN